MAYDGRSGRHWVAPHRRTTAELDVEDARSQWRTRGPRAATPRLTLGAAALRSPIGSPRTAWRRLRSPGLVRDVHAFMEDWFSFDEGDALTKLDGEAAHSLVGGAQA